MHSRLLVSAALLCLLVAAEAMTVTHALDFDAHTAGETCKICLSVSGLDSAAPARTLVLLPPAAATAVVLPGQLPPVFARLERPVARGPPSIS